MDTRNTRIAHRALILGAALGIAASAATAAHAAPAPAPADAPPAILANTTALDGLAPVHIDRAKGAILLTLPAPAADGIALTLLYTPSLRTGLGAAPTFLDRGRIGETRLLAFRIIGGKVAIQYLNPRFQRAGDALGTPAPGTTSPDFATATPWIGPIAATLPDGRVIVDIAPFLKSDTLGIADSLSQHGDAMGTALYGPQGAGSGFRLSADLSTADPSSLKDFPDNIEADALVTFTSDTPGAEVANAAADGNSVSFTLHHSFVALPPPGFTPRAFDPRIGGFATQIVDFSAPLGQDVVRDVASRFRLERTDPTAARSRVKKPIIFYIDPAAPEPIRDALIEGVNWWAEAFNEAGFIDAFHAELLPPGADPMDARYNVVNWVDRATRGWSYGQDVVDPRTGEIVKGMVVLGSLRTRQDIELYKSLVGLSELNSGRANDPARVALLRLRQLAAHEVGHALGYAHNFAASTQDRASVMDYPPPRVRLVNGAPDLSDAYAVGIGAWDKATVAWLYGAPDDAAAKAIADKTIEQDHMRYATDSEARSPDTAQPYAGLWDDGADPVAALGQIMAVRRAALDRFGLDNLAPGEPMANLRRRFVPLWLLHRYEVNAAAKSIGGVDYTYATKGDGREASAPVPPARQRAAIAAVVATLDTQALTVPPRLVPLLSAARNGSDNRQFDIEVMSTAGINAFDALAAAETAARLTLNTLLSPGRLARMSEQNATDPAQPGLSGLLDALLATALPAQDTPVSRRIATTTLLAMAQAARAPTATPEVSLALNTRVHDVAATLAHRPGSAESLAWSQPLSRLLLDSTALAKALDSGPAKATIPPGEPIGSDDDL